MKPLNSYKEVPKLTGSVATLNRFIFNSGKMNLPFFKNLRHMSKEKKLKAYLEAHPIKVVTDQPLKRVLSSAALSGRLTTWAIELRKFDISYIPRTSVRECRSTHFGTQEDTMEMALRLSLPSTNNEAEYEAMITGLRLVKSLRVEELLVVEISQVLKWIIFEHIPRVENERADRLSRLDTTYYSELPEGVYVEVYDQPAYKKEVIKSIVRPNSMDWRDSIIEYLAQGRLPNCTSKPRRGLGIVIILSKLSPKWEGPYRVKRIVGPSTYELEDLDGRSSPRTWYASKLCKYYV
ncbi:hypothetical protein LIER_29219 [Lithospermum erythrorhizon]|uniref:Reverse transcriptase RNase H-like domain-containing protein n=1 Tax=Lithospermum erythrorhizon TaxID=34254 RepID=A0AAV3RNI8_LITER